MVKTLNIPMDDLDFEELEKKKGKDISWKDFILLLKNIDIDKILKKRNKK